MKDFKYLKYTFSKLYLRTNDKQTNDFNFFSPYIIKKKQTKDKFLCIIVVAAVLLFIFIGNFVWNVVKINKMEKEISEMKKIMNSNDTQAKFKEADNLNKKYDILKKYYDEANVISNAINKNQVISSDLIKKISSTLPQSVSFKTVAIDTQSIQIQGTAGSRVNIAELQYNLKQLENIKDVQVVNINKSSDSSENNNNTVETGNEYIFTLKCTLKDVEVNEN